MHKRSENVFEEALKRDDTKNKIRVVVEISPAEYQIFKIYLHLKSPTGRPLKMVDWFKGEIKQMRKEIASDGGVKR